MSMRGLQSRLVTPFSWHSPEDSGILGRERGQALVRVFATIAVTLYLLYMHAPHNFTHGVPAWLIFSVGFFALSLALLWHVLHTEGSLAPRRYLANLADAIAATYLMIAVGEIGMPLFLFYLWVTLGSGFRFGVSALLVSTLLSCAGFSLVIAMTEVWRNNPTLAASVLITLIGLPSLAIPYISQHHHKDSIAVSTLLSRLISPFKWIKSTGSNLLGRERGQALIRVFVSIVVALYLVHAYNPNEFTGTIAPWMVFVTYAVLSAAFFWHILRSKTSPTLRHYVANLADTVVISYGMVIAGKAGMPLFVLYLWITFGNGFRFGIRALIVSATLSIIGFSAVFAMTETWKSLPAFTISVVYALIVLPLYAAHLVNQINRALARAEEASAVKSQFLARMSHELRTPLNGILGAAELLETSRRFTSEERALLQVIRDSVEVSLRQIGNVLDFSKLEAGKLVLEHADIDLHEVINSTVNMVRPLALQKRLSLLVRVAPETPFCVVGDAHHLRAILLNLLSNAVKFTEQGSVCLEVTPGSTAQQDGTIIIRFEVLDTGTGIVPEALKHIFDSFAQEDTSTTRRYGGTGLGTSIAKQLVELMDGHIGVESRKDEGSLFWFEVPFKEQAQEANRSQTLPGVRVALLTQDAHQIDYYTDALGVIQGQLIPVRSGNEALDTLARAIRLGNPMDAFLVDSKLAINDKGEHLFTGLCEKVRAASALAILIADTSPSLRQLQDWGYSAVLHPHAEPSLVYAALRSSPVRFGNNNPDVVNIAPWLWGDREKVNRPRILVVDDNRTNLMIVQRMLEQGGYEVEAVQTGDEALNKLCAGGYRAAVIDMHMPGLDGVGVLRQYRLLRPRVRLPVIMLTANVSFEAQRDSAEAGADAYLTKPVTAAKLLAEVGRLVKETEVQILRLNVPQQIPPLRQDAETSGDILEISVLAELDRLYGDPRELERVIQEYEREGYVLLDRIERACETGNHAAFCDGVHAFKGNAANVGATQLLRVCSEAEAAGIVEFTRDRDQLMSRLKRAFSATLVALRELLQASRSQRDRPPAAGFNPPI